MGVKVRGEGKGQVKRDVSVSQNSFPLVIIVQASQIPKTGGLLPFLGSQVNSWVLLKTYYFILMKLLNGAISILVQSQSKTSSVDVFLFFSFPRFSTAISVSE